MFTTQVNAQNTPCQNRQCIAVVDAGSTGSRVHLYAYDLDASHHPIQIDEIWSQKIRPGFSTLNKESIDSYLTKLFSSAPEQNVPVYFYATAGMRLLSHPTQQQYYHALQQWFATQPQWQLIEAKTITGREEGVLGWLAVNYQLGAFSEPNKPLVSVMDMGGASVQITFPVKHSENISPQDLMEINVLGHPVALFVHSFLGLGQTLLSQQFLDEEKCYPRGYQLPSALLGEGDALSCQQEVTKLINGVHAVNNVTGSASSENTSNTWYALGGVTNLVQDKLFAFDNNQFTSEDLLQQANSQICHQQWSDLYNKYPKNDYLPGYCLFASYYYALMINGYGLKPEQPINMLPAYKSADWSLGVVLHQH